MDKRSGCMRWIHKVRPETKEQKENTKKKKLFWSIYRELRNFREVLPAHKETIAQIEKTDPNRAWELTLKWHKALDEILDRLSAVEEWE